MWWWPLISTHGACFADWGTNPRHTPLGMFAEMAFDGTLPQGDDLIRLLAQFAKIQGCDWAHHMIAALRCGDFILNGEHVYT